MVQYKFGRLPNDPSKPRLSLTPFLSADLTIPRKRDWYSQVTDWQMYLNDQIGDCTVADLAHTLKQTGYYGSGNEISVTDADVLTFYKAVSGYNGTEATDNGAVIQDVQNYWRKTGIAGHKSLAFAEVDVSNINQVATAIDIFGSVHLGMNFPAFAMDQFNHNQKWDVQIENNQIQGGHDVVGVGYDLDAGLIYVVTWGAIQAVTVNFFHAYFEEGWVTVLPEWLNSLGKTPEGLDLYGLGEQLKALTGAANPFPAPTPVPVPTPAPTVDPDKVLWESVKAWSYAKHVTTNKAAAVAVQKWAKAKGF